MSELRTDLQRQLMGCIVVITARNIRSGKDGNVTTAELSRMTGRYGQVIGHSCGSMADRGLLQRMAPATYRLTRKGIDAAKQDTGAIKQEMLASRSWLNAQQPD